MKSGAEETRLIVTRAGDVAQLSWPSDRDKYYTVLYAEQRNAKSRWQPLPQATNLRGAGKAILVEDKIPAGRNRYYRLHITAAPLK